MDAEQKRLVQASWCLLAEHHDQVAIAFYERLFDIAPHTRAMFSRTNMVDQRAKVVAMLSDIVQNLDEPDWLIPSIGGLGRRHREYGARAADYDAVREALLAAIGGALGQTLTRDVREAWEAAYALTASVMKRAGE
jgi:hemoglobin-like flavoprotein